MLELFLVCIFFEIEWFVELFDILFKENFEEIFIVVFECSDEECEVGFNNKFCILFGLVRVVVFDDFNFRFVIDVILFILLVFCFEVDFFIVL